MLVMSISYLHSIQDVSFVYETGDRPVLVLCSDMQQYICKYMRPNSTIAYKLECELIGAQMADAWNLNTPPVAIVNIKPNHWNNSVSHSIGAPAIGFRKMENVLDVASTTYKQVTPNKDTLYQLLKIALFDFWIANEDRTCNNANLLYNVETEQIISIDYGGVLNNVLFDNPLSQLTETDSILCADIFAHICKAVSPKTLFQNVQLLEKDYYKCIGRGRKKKSVLQTMPKEWSVSADKVALKIDELFATQWIEETWQNFVECLKSNSNYGK